jgi:hypothetical protein
MMLALMTSLEFCSQDMEASARTIATNATHKATLRRKVSACSDLVTSEFSTSAATGTIAIGRSTGD